MRRVLQFAGAVCACAALCAAAPSTDDQNKAKNSPPPKAASNFNTKTAGATPPKTPPAENAGGGTPKAGPRLPNPNPNNPVEVLRRLSPDERERVLEKYPPQQAARIRQQLDAFDRQPEAQKQRQLALADQLRSLPPEQRDLVRKDIDAFNKLDPERRKAVLAAYRRLSNSTPEQRADILARPQFQARFSPDELEILKVLPEYMPLLQR